MVKASRSFLDEIRADNHQGRHPCLLTPFLLTLPKPLRVEILLAIRTDEVSVSAIHRGLQRRGFTRSDMVVRRHRSRSEPCPFCARACR